MAQIDNNDILLLGGATVAAYLLGTMLFKNKANAQQRILPAGYAPTPAPARYTQLAPPPTESPYTEGAPQGKMDIADDRSESTSIYNNPQPNKWTTEYFPLTKGMVGGNVKALQQKLRISADGKLGDGTERAMNAAGLYLPLSNDQYDNYMKGLAKGAVNVVDFLAKTANYNDHTLLKRGSKGYQVIRLQKFLGFADKKAGVKYPAGSKIADGVFGTLTANACLSRFKKDSITVSELEGYISGPQATATDLIRKMASQAPTTLKSLFGK